MKKGIRDSFSQINKDASYEYFGGGDDSDIDPNIIDMLCLPRAAWTQKHQLNNYCTATSKKTILQPISKIPPPYQEILHYPVTSIENSIGCLDSEYQTTPQNRYIIMEENNNDNDENDDSSTDSWQLNFSADPSDLQEYGSDLEDLIVTVEEVSNCIFRLIIQDKEKKRFTLPKVRDYQNPIQSSLSTESENLYTWQIDDHPFFSFSISRNPNVFNHSDSETPLFNSKPSSTNSFRNLVFKDRYIEFSTQLPAESSLYGLGEHVSSFELNRNDKIYSIFNIDQGTPTNKNLYGT